MRPPKPAASTTKPRKARKASPRGLKPAAAQQQPNPDTNPPKPHTTDRETNQTLETVPPRGRGASPIYTEESANEICERVANGESVNKICQRPGMPSADTVYRWLQTRKDFSDNYARARERRADLLADECIEIADDNTRDMILIDGEVRVDHEHVQRSRLRVDARKWYAGKLAPKKYGDNLQVSGNPDAPLGVKFIIEGLPSPPARIEGKK